MDTPLLNFIKRHPRASAVGTVFALVSGAVGVLGDVQAVAAMFEWLSQSWNDILAFALTPAFRWIAGLLPSVVLGVAGWLIYQRDSASDATAVLREADIAKRLSDARERQAQEFASALETPNKIIAAYHQDRALRLAEASLVELDGHLKAFRERIAALSSGGKEMFSTRGGGSLLNYDPILLALNKTATLMRMGVPELDLRRPRPFVGSSHPQDPAIHEFDPSLNEPYLKALSADYKDLAEVAGAFRGKITQRNMELKQEFESRGLHYGI